jgi:hypothetical protein
MPKDRLKVEGHFVQVGLVVQVGHIFQVGHVKTGLKQILQG